jgi:hypothetical protein
LSTSSSSLGVWKQQQQKHQRQPWLRQGQPRRDMHAAAAATVAGGGNDGGGGDEDAKALQVCVYLYM